MPPGALAVAVVVDQAAAPFAAQFAASGRRATSVASFFGMLRLVVVAVERPGLHLALVQLRRHAAARWKGWWMW